MNKSLEAFFRGYYVFHVNRKRFWLYNSARKYKTKLLEDGARELIFTGESLWRGKQCFYQLIAPTAFQFHDYEKEITSVGAYYDKMRKINQDK